MISVKGVPVLCLKCCIVVAALSGTALLSPLLETAVKDVDLGVAKGFEHECSTSGEPSLASLVDDHSHGLANVEGFHHPHEVGLARHHERIWRIEVLYDLEVEELGAGDTALIMFPVSVKLALWLHG